MLLKGSGGKRFPICQRQAIPEPIIPDDQKPTFPPNDHVIMGSIILPAPAALRDDPSGLHSVQIFLKNVTQNIKPNPSVRLRRPLST